MQRLHAALLVGVGATATLACSSTSGSGSGQPAQDAATMPTSDAPDTDTWDNWALNFFTTYCVECHAANNPKGLNFGVQSIVAANKDTIRCGVCVSQDPAWGCPASPPAKQFPISDSTGSNPKPSDADRNRVVAWIEAGCK
jgi:hypothetical protein